jgi:hypothetical protein
MNRRARIRILVAVHGLGVTGVQSATARAMDGPNSYDTGRAVRLAFLEPLRGEFQNSFRRRTLQ